MKKVLEKEAEADNKMKSYLAKEADIIQLNKHSSPPEFVNGDEGVLFCTSIHK